MKRRMKLGLIKREKSTTGTSTAKVMRMATRLQMRRTLDCSVGEAKRKAENQKEQSSNKQGDTVDINQVFIHMMTQIGNALLQSYQGQQSQALINLLANANQLAQGLPQQQQLQQQQQQAPERRQYHTNYNNYQQQSGYRRPYGSY